MEYAFRYGELGLKAKQRSFWEFILRNNILKGLEKRGINPQDVVITYNQKRGQLKYIGENKEQHKIEKKIQDTLTKTPGISWWSKIYNLGKINNIDHVITPIRELLLKYGIPRQVDARRYISQPYISRQWLKKQVWELIQEVRESSQQLPVLDRLIIQIDHTVSALIPQPGVGGLPISTTGKGVVLLSGGIDSPVSAFRAFKRGVRADLLHFHPPGMEVENTKIFELFKILAEYNPYVRLYTTYSQTFSKLAANGLYNAMVIYRRLMLRVAAAFVRKKYKFGFVITGDSLGQVASQTFSNLKAQSLVLCEPNIRERVLLVRPLIAMDKAEIIEEAKQLGTYDISIKEYKDCCSMLAKFSKTQTNLERLEQTEQQINMQTLVEEALNNMKEWKL